MTLLNLNDIYLASSSPRRRELLAQIGIQFQLLPVTISEEVKGNELVEDHVNRLALEKARAGWQSLQRIKNIPVLGADTVVVIDEMILGKPKHREDGIGMLLKLSGKTHEVITSIALVQETRERVMQSVSRVQFRDLTSSEASAYWETDEPIDKAGGYAIQGQGAIFIKRIEGSYSGIMGLPLYETAALLKQFGAN